jgi:hypothetical protein
MEKEIIEYAFPLTDASDGMTLRDYFAAKAISGIMAAQYFGGGSAEYCAEAAYIISDAMLIARKK